MIEFLLNEICQFSVRNGNWNYYVQDIPPPLLEWENSSKFVLLQVFFLSSGASHRLFISYNNFGVILRPLAFTLHLMETIEGSGGR